MFTRDLHGWKGDLLSITFGTETVITVMIIVMNEIYIGDTCSTHQHVSSQQLPHDICKYKILETLC